MSRVEKVAPACQWVAERAGHVRIHREKIPAYTAFILGKYSLISGMDPHLHHIAADRRETAAYILALDSINFGSGYFHAGLEYNTIAEGLKKTFERGELSRPEQWAAATPEYFSQALSAPVDELMVQFARHLRAAGEKIIAEYQGKVVNLLEEAGYSALKLANIVAAWDSFRDIHVYKGMEIPFLKRAQILAADMNLALGGFTDMDRLTIFADNMVPHVLRCDGILEYDAGLAAKIDSGALIPSGSEEEIEIRASAIHAAELMKQAAHRQGRMVMSVNLDHLLWHRGYEPELYQKPRHRTLTTDY
ncbi:MAG: queuosine salvage family protein [Alphaproteobacteria bacterium]|nr:queuosine salvage family protein [Alphaproteobacteria bacterium]